MADPRARKTALIPKALAVVVLTLASAGSIEWSAYQPPFNAASLAGVAAASATDVWAVGLKSGGECQYATLAVHWNGSMWSPVATPSVQRVNSVLADVDALSADDAWAVGHTACPGRQDGRTLVEHWDGSAWQRVSSPNSGSFAVLSAVAALAPDDVWAVGSTVVGVDGVALTEHWNGTRWRIVPAPALTGNDDLEDVAGSSSKDVWAVGAAVGADGNDRPLVEHWDGAAWQLVTVSTPGGAPGYLAGVAAISPTNAWAVGGYRPGGGALQPLLLHWNGVRWRLVSVPSLGDFAALTAIARSGSGLFAAGFTVPPDASHAVVLERSNDPWQEVDAPPDLDLSDLAATRSGELFAVSGPAVWRGVPGP